MEATAITTCRRRRTGRQRRRPGAQSPLALEACLAANTTRAPAVRAGPAWQPWAAEHGHPDHAAALAAIAAYLTPNRVPCRNRAHGARTARADGSGTVTITSSKTDQEGRGHMRCLGAPTMQRLVAWLSAAGINGATVTGRLGARSSARSSPSTQRPRALPGRVSEHSLRVGAASVVRSKPAPV